MSDLKKCEQSTANIAPHDVVWKLEQLIPVSPKKDGRAEAYLREIDKTCEEYICTTLVATRADTCNKCSICQQEEKTTRFCRLIKNSTAKDMFICTDCINVFIEYNPESVLDLKTKENESL